MQLKLDRAGYRVSPEFALENISFSLDNGEMAALMGPNGSGKTTLLKLIAGLRKLDNGTILYDGSSKFPYGRIGMLFQFPERQFFALDVKKELTYGVDASDDDILTALDIVKLDKSVLKDSPFDLSGGEKRRLALASVLIRKPSLIILDEPFAGLDPLFREELKNILSILRARGVSIIISTHDQEGALSADTLLVMKDGRLVRRCTPGEVLLSSEESLKEGFIPSDRALLISEIKRLGLKEILV